MSELPHACSNVALAGRADDPRVGEAMATLAAHLLHRGRRVRAARSGAGFAGLAVEFVEESALACGADLVVAVGGDGAMLHASRMAASCGVPVLGVNRGRLGFLADVAPSRMIESVDAALDGRCTPENRMLLEARVQREDATGATALALNDVAIAKQDTGRMLDLQTWVDGGYVNTHAGDGFIVSTSTGSTAYALSCGGPIVHPGLDAIVLVPICPHTLSDRPIVVSAGSVVELELADRPDTRAQVVCDGIALCELEPGARLRISRAAVSATMLHPPGHDYFRILRSKLHWGRGGREGRRPED